MIPIDDVPLTASCERVHVLDDIASCWCHPITHLDGDGFVRIIHRPEGST